MAYAGTETVTRDKDLAGQAQTKVVTAALDADDEEGSSIDMRNRPVTKAGMSLNRTAGTTDTVSIKIQGSVDGTIWEDVLEITDSSTTALTWASAFATKIFNYFKCVAPTIGAGNTITATWYLK